MHKPFKTFFSGIILFVLFTGTVVCAKSYDYIDITNPNLRKIPMGNDAGILKFLKSELNFIRIPLPAVRITPSGIWYGLYF